MICGVIDIKSLFLIIRNLSICLISFIILLIIRVSIILFSLIFLIKDVTYFIEWELISLNSRIILITFLFDWISLIFISFVLFISSLVIFYRKEYISSDIFINRFILLVVIFVFSIIMLIIRPNLIRILLGWDGLGLVSYCLVIYFQNIKSYNAGILTALSNRIGDVALLIAIAWILNYGSWNYIFYIEIIKIDFSISLIALFVILAAITKRAQIPFSSWLPAAIAAPTPVSALVHSSTLVTAGVYLLIRFNLLIVDTFFSKFLLLIGGLTIFMAGLSANFEFDLKKIIALSTLSQLGLIIRILAIGFPKLAFFHLLTHALFKALLFMCAGAIIHNIKNSQDIRDMGSLINWIPITTICLNVANLALCGIPFLAGFYSKDIILEIVLLSSTNFFSFFLFFFSTGLTVCYSFRLVYYSLSGSFNESAINILNEERFIMSIRIISLIVIAVIGGSLLNWLIFSCNYIICLPIILKFLTLIVCVSGAFLGYILRRISFYHFNKSIYYYFFSFFNGSILFMPLIRTAGVVEFPIKLGGSSLKIFDQGWSEYFGGQNIYFFIKKLSITNQILQNNNLKIYLIIFIFWIIFLVFLLILY